MSNFLEQPDLVAITEKLAALVRFSDNHAIAASYSEQAGLGPVHSRTRL